MYTTHIHIVPISYKSASLKASISHRTHFIHTSCMGVRIYAITVHTLYEHYTQYQATKVLALKRPLAIGLVAYMYQLGVWIYAITVHTLYEHYTQHQATRVLALKRPLAIGLVAYMYQLGVWIYAITVHTLYEHYMYMQYQATKVLALKPPLVIGFIAYIPAAWECGYMQ